MIERLRQRPLLYVVLAGALLSAPIMTLDFEGDDFMHQLVLRDYAAGLESTGLVAVMPARDPFGFVNAYHFLDGDPQRAARFRAEGNLPWWALPELRIHFARPLSSAIMLASQIAVGSSSFVEHAISWLFYIFVIAVFALIWRRSLPNPKTTVLALAMFALSERHFFPVAWIANRHALVSIAFAGLGLLCHLRWRERGWTPGLPISLVCFLAGLAAGESALAIFAFVLAYELWGAPRRRFAAMVPATVLALGWAAFYKIYHLGTFGSGMYIDPTGEPLRFILTAPLRLSRLLLSLLAGVSADVGFLVPQLVPFQIAAGAAVVVGAALWFRRSYPRLPPQTQRAVVWLGAGGMGALVPALAAMPFDRLLVLPELGFSAVLAIFLHDAWQRRLQERRVGVIAALLLVRHLLIAPATFLAIGAIVMISGHATNRVDEETPNAAPHVEQLIVLRASDPQVAVYMPARWAFKGRPLTRRGYLWSMGAGDHQLTRVSDTEVELVALSGGLFDSAFGHLFRDRQHPMAPGDTVRLVDHTLEVTAVNEGEVTAIRVRFDEVPGAETHFVAWLDGKLRTVTLPAPGGTVDLPFSPGPMGL